jgi:hypothetical protein
MARRLFRVLPMGVLARLPAMATASGRTPTGRPKVQNPIRQPEQCRRAPTTVESTRASSQTPVSPIIKAGIAERRFGLSVATATMAGNGRDWQVALIS